MYHLWRQAYYQRTSRSVDAILAGDELGGSLDQLRAAITALGAEATELARCCRTAVSSAPS